MPGARDERHGEPSALIGDETDGVAFLDAPGLDAAELAAAIERALLGLEPGAVLAVYSGRVTRPAFVDLCAAGHLELVATIPNTDGGITFTVRASSSAATPAAEPAATPTPPMGDDLPGPAPG